MIDQSKLNQTFLNMTKRFILTKNKKINNKFTLQLKLRLITYNKIQFNTI